MTIHVQLILRALLAAPGREMYGLEIIRAAGLPSGTVYPILARLESAGWLSFRAEDINSRAEKRPARRYYRLTAEGAVVAREAMERAAVQLAALGVAAPGPVRDSGIPVTRKREPGNAPAPASVPPVRESRRRNPASCRHENMPLHRGFCPDCEVNAVKGKAGPA